MDAQLLFVFSWFRGFVVSCFRGFVIPWFRQFFQRDLRGYDVASMVRLSPSWMSQYVMLRASARTARAPNVEGATEYRSTTITFLASASNAIRMTTLAWMIPRSLVMTYVSVWLNSSAMSTVMMSPNTTWNTLWSSGLSVRNTTVSTTLMMRRQTATTMTAAITNVSTKATIVSKR